MERQDQVPGTSFMIWQDKKLFSYGIDAILLSNFAKPRGVVMDLGTGTGIIPLRIAENPKIDLIYGVELQEIVAKMAEKSVYLNKLENRIVIINEDIRNLPEKFPKASVDTVITNPPYMKAGAALVNPEENHAFSRHELACTLEDLMRVSSYLLRPNGKLFMVHRPNRLVDVLCAMRESSIEPKLMRWVYPKPGKPANLFLIEGVKGGRRDLKYGENILVYKEDGEYTDQIYSIYGREK